MVTSALRIATLPSSRPNVIPCLHNGKKAGLNKFSEVNIDDTFAIFNALSLNKATLNKIRADWVEELDPYIRHDMGQGIGRINSSTSCDRLGFIQFKALHRTHYSQARLSTISPNINEICDRCHTEEEDLTHMFWSCNVLNNFWSTVFQALSEAFDNDVQPSVKLAIFGVPGEVPHCRIRSKKVCWPLLLFSPREGSC